MTEPQQAGGAGARHEPAAPLMVVVPLSFGRPLTPVQQAVVERVAALLVVHQFEVHDIRPEGEQITRIAVRDHLFAIEPLFDAGNPAAARVRFSVGSREDKEVLVWTSSLMFQYLHFHVVPLTAINDAPHTLDWEAGQDPGLSDRVKRWVEGGRSLIERLKRVQRD